MYVMPVCICRPLCAYRSMCVIFRTVGFKALTAVLIKIQIFVNVRLCRWVKDLGCLTLRIKEILPFHISGTNITVLHPTKL